MLGRERGKGGYLTLRGVHVIPFVNGGKSGEVE